MLCFQAISLGIFSAALRLCGSARDALDSHGHFRREGAKKSITSPYALTGVIFAAESRSHKKKD